MNDKVWQASPVTVSNGSNGWQGSALARQGGSGGHGRETVPQRWHGQETVTKRWVPGMQVLLAF